MFSAMRMLLTRRAAVVSPFVTRDPATGYLMLGGQRYRFSGANVDSIGLTESTTGYGETRDVDNLYTPNHTEITAVLDAANAMNARVLRPFSCLTVGKTNAVQPSLGVFNDAAFEPTDYALQQCAIRGMKLILPLVDNYTYFTGGKFWYCTANGVTPDGNASQFFSNTTIITSFKAHISRVLNHVNTYTGVKYKDDPTILAWQTGNELTNGGAVNDATFISWTSSIATHIKGTESAQQLVADGGFGITGDWVTYATGRLALSNVDIYSTHSYDNYRSPGNVVLEAEAAHAAGKAFLLDEYTWTDSGGWQLPTMLAVLQDSAVIDGDAFWDLSAPLTNHGGGFRLHYPGDDFNMATRATQLKNHAQTMPVPPVVAGGTFLTDAFTLSTTVIPPDPNTVVALGDSITDYATAYDYQPWIGNSWFDQLVVRSNQRMKYCGTYATGGFNLTQIRDTHIPQVLALNPLPAFCIIAGGTNDAQDVGRTYNRTYSAGVLNDIITSLVGAGITPILWAITPHVESAANVTDWNTYIHSLATSTGYAVLDAFSACSNGSTGWLSGYTSDGLHPSAAGMQAIAAKGISDGLPSIFPANDPHLLVARGTTDLTNLINDGTNNLGLMSTDTDADGAANGFTRAGSSTLISLVTPGGGDDVVGKWQRLRQSAAGQQLAITRNITTGWVAGDTLAFSARVKTQNILTTVTPWHLKVDASVPGGFTTPSGSVLTTVSNGIIAWLNDVDGLLYVEFQVPTGTTGLQFIAYMDVASGGEDPTVDFGEVTIRNLGRTVGPTALDSHTADSGATWSKQPGNAGVFTIQSNRLWGSGATSSYLSSVHPVSADYEVSANINIVTAISNTAAGVCGRMSVAADTKYTAFVYAYGGGFFLFVSKNVNGSYTELGHVTIPVQPTVGSTHAVTLRMVGNQISAKWDGTTLVGPFTDTSVSSIGKAGVTSSPFTASTGFQIDSVIGVIAA